jgi:hypothetical protein
MNYFNRTVDRVLSRFAPTVSASACVPPDGYYLCNSHYYLYWCYVNCSGIGHCTLLGRC